VISVLADPICYHFYQRPDYWGASTGLTDPDSYYGYVREVLEIVEAHTEPGQRRDALLQRFARIQVLRRLRGPRFLAHPDAYRAALFASVKSVVEEHFPPSVDELLAPFQRTQMALVRVGRLDLLVEAAKWEQRLGVALLPASDRPESGPYDLTVEAGLAVGRMALSLERHDEQFLLELPRDIAAVVPDQARAVTVPLSGSASIVARHRGDSGGRTIPAQVTRRIEERQGHYTIVDRVEATIDPGTFVSESRGSATWDIFVHIAIAGLIREMSVAKIQVASDSGVTVRQGPSAGDTRLVREARRLGLAGLMTVSRHMDPRLRQRLWHIAARLVSYLDS